MHVYQLTAVTTTTLGKESHADTAPVIWVDGYYHTSSIVACSNS